MNPKKLQTLRKLQALLGALGLLLLPLCASATQPSISLSGMPLFFEPQEPIVGEVPSFLARGQNYQFSITPTGAQIVLSKLDSEQNELIGHASRIARHASRTVEMQIPGANPYAHIHGDGILAGKMNYLIGNNPSEWRTDQPIFSKIQIDDVYPGINLIYYGNQQQLEYDFVVAPHASAESIALRFDGVDTIEINNNGELVLSFDGNEIRFHRPLIYQEVRGVRQPISGGYRFEDARTVTFSVGQYDHNLPLIIDPILAYSGYFGGNFGDVALGVKVDSSGSIYIAGETLSRKWPFTSTLPGSVTNNGGRFNGDGFVAKLSNDASTLIYFTYIGGHEDDGILDLALDSAGNPYITGFTDSTNFPTTNAAFPNISGSRSPIFHTYPSDAFVAELNRTNGSLIYSTYLGGSGADVAGAITVDSGGNAYVTGYTYSTNFPTDSGVFANIQSTLVGFTNGLSGSNDIFVAKIAPGGAGLKYVTLFGGSGLDSGEGIAVDDSNRVYVCGYTGSTNFYTTNSLPGTNGLGIRHINGVTNDVRVYNGLRHIPFDAFLARFNTDVSGPGSVEYSTLFGGKFDDAAFRMVLYSNTDVIITGNSHSPDFPTNNLPSPLRSFANGGNADAFLIRFSFTNNPPAPVIVYSKLFGGSSDDIGWDLALDPSSGNVYVVGITSSADFRGTNGLTANGAPFLRTNHIALRDVFVTAFSQDASTILYSVQMGGNNEDFGYGIAVDSSGSAYIVGRTVSGNFPFTNVTTNIFNPKRNGTNDAFLAKILLNTPPAPPPPVLETKLLSTGIQLDWPDASSGYILECNTNLANSGGWVPVSGFPFATNNGFLQVQIPMTNGSLFFRLRR